MALDALSSVSPYGGGTMKVSIKGPVGLLEGELWMPEGEPLAGIVLGHPHPLHGGSMTSSVVFRAGRALQESGVAVLRLNYRGVGQSAGEYDGAGGEVADHRSALDWLGQELEACGVPIWAGGFSFGARTAAVLAHQEDRGLRPGPGQVLLIALPVLEYPCEEVGELKGPGLIVMAAEDEYGNASDLTRAFPTIAERFSVREVPDANHFFQGYLPDLQECVGAWARGVLHTDQGDG